MAKLVLIVFLMLLLLQYVEPFYTSDPTVTIQLPDRSSLYKRFKGNGSHIFPNIEKMFKIEGEKVVSL